GLRNKTLESRRLVHGDIGHDLAVQLDARLGEPADKSRIREALFADSRVDALNPECAEFALPHFAVAVRVMRGLLDSGIGRAEGFRATAIKALRLLQNFLVTGVSGDAAFDASHFKSPSGWVARAISARTESRASRDPHLAWPVRTCRGSDGCICHC